MLVLSALILSLAALFWVDKPLEGKVVDEELLTWADSVRFRQQKKFSKRPDTVFYFNPNVESVKRLQQLGFSNLTIINLLKYREAGGVIRKPKKLQEIYGVDSVLFQKLEKYIQVEQAKVVSSQSKSYVRYEEPKPINRGREEINVSGKKVLAEEFKIEINSADTAVLTLLKGIGPVLSRRIVAYRKKIGGYYSIRQLLEVYGVKEQVIKDNREVLIVDEQLIVPMNVSKASLRQMKNHPYLNFYMAKDIYEARKVGKLVSIEQFCDSAAFVEADMVRLGKYFSVGAETSFDN